MAKAVWILKYGTIKFLLYHMKFVLVESWDALKVSYRNITRDSFAKTKLPPPPSDLLTSQQISRHVLPPYKYLLEPRLNKSTIYQSTQLHILRYK